MLTSRLAVALTTAFILAATATAAEDVALTAPAILERLGRTYRECRTYRDSGVVATTFEEKSGTRLDKKPFKTAFIRPDLFRFEYESSFYGRRSRYIVWQSGTAVRSWWSTDPGVMHEASLGDALAGATGVSGGSAHKVPSLLMPEVVGGRQMTTLGNPQRLPDALDRGVACFRVSGSYGRVPVVLWIDKRTFLLRRFDDEKRFVSFRTRTTTTYDPVMNQPVASTLLEFNAGDAGR